MAACCLWLCALGCALLLAACRAAPARSPTAAPISLPPLPPAAPRPKAGIIRAIGKLKAPAEYVELSANAPAGALRLEGSTNLVHWTVLAHLPELDPGPIRIRDYDRTPQKFYRFTR